MVEQNFTWAGGMDLYENVRDSIRDDRLDLPDTSLNGEQTDPNKYKHLGLSGVPSLVTYLERIGLKRNPFWCDAAEDDFGDRAGWRLRADDSADFSPLSFYVDPQNGSRTKTLDQLGQKGHAFVFGAPGTGKTTLRLAQAAKIRREPDDVLAVTYKLNGRTSQASDPEDHYLELTKALVVDLFIQIVEQFDTAPAPTPEMNERLGKLIDLSDKPIWHVANHLATEKEPTSSWGYAEGLWSWFQRPAVRSVLESAGLKAWLIDILSLQNSVRWNDEPSGQEAWHYALETARLWQFEYVYVLVDAERAVNSSTPAIRALIEKMPEFEQARVYLKFFLPPDLEKIVKETLQAGGRKLYAYAVVRLEWSKEGLQHLLRERFREAGSRREGFADLVEADMVEVFDERLFDAAKVSNHSTVDDYSGYSPRKLIGLIKQLIKIHIDSLLKGTVVSLHITAEEWDLAKERYNEYYEQSIRSNGFASHERYSNASPIVTELPLASDLTVYS